MRWRRPDWSRLAAWLGVIALGLNALVPIHLAFDLADALEPAHHAASRHTASHHAASHHAAAETAGTDRQVIALLCGHEADGQHHHHHDKPGSNHGCPVCAVAATLAALALPIVAALPRPAATAVRLDAGPGVAAPPAILAAAYHSRAPPTA